jgi:hypothetical protein
MTVPRDGDQEALRAKSLHARGGEPHPEQQLVALGDRGSAACDATKRHPPIPHRTCYRALRRNATGGSSGKAQRSLTRCLMSWQGLSTGCLHRSRTMRSRISGRSGSLPLATGVITRATRSAAMNAALHHLVMPADIMTAMIQQLATLPRYKGITTT